MRHTIISSLALVVVVFFCPEMMPSEARAEDPPRPAANPAAQPPVASVGRVVGAAWLNRNDGSSDVLRGLRVQVIKKDVNGSDVAAAAARNLEEWKNIRTQWMQAKAYVTDTLKASDKESTAEADLWIQKSEQNIKSISEFLDKPPEKIGVEEAKTLLNKWHPEGSSTVPISPIKTTSTNVDGKYVIADCPSGKWFLYAVVASGKIWVDWLVPIEVRANEELSIDLFNDNARTIKDVR